MCFLTTWHIMSSKSSQHEEIFHLSNPASHNPIKKLCRSNCWSVWLTCEGEGASVISIYGRAAVLLCIKLPDVGIINKVPGGSVVHQANTKPPYRLLHRSATLPSCGLSAVFIMASLRYTISPHVLCFYNNMQNNFYPAWLHHITVTSTCSLLWRQHALNMCTDIILHGAARSRGEMMS